MDMSKDLKHTNLIENRPENQRVLLRLLSLISDKEAQKQYEEDVPIANVPAELLCMWFDDHYPIGKSWFKTYYFEEDQKLIEEFSNFYEERLEFLPSTHKLKELHQSKVWDEIVRKAQFTLERIFEIESRE